MGSWNVGVKKILLLPALGFLTSSLCFAQSGGALHGNFQADAQYYFPDSAIDAPKVDEKMLLNSFANFVYESDNFSAGIRFESYYNALLGFDKRYTGSGIPYRYLRYNNDGLDVTVGNFYEQYGSGLILRAYEERGLGYDNAIDGLRVAYRPVPGITLKALTGKQRFYMTVGPGIVRGIDGEIALSETFKSLADAKTRITLGGSFVSKFQSDDDPVYVLPENVGAGAGRINIQRGYYSFYAEYAHKSNDPSFSNSYIYKDGEGLVVNMGYSKPGFGLSLSGKRIDNMSFRSDRSASVNDLLINYLPAMTRNHTYALCAYYPYATQPNGEMGMQAEMFFKIKPDKPFGGKFGTDVAINYSNINSIAKAAPPDTNAIGVSGTEGYSSDFLKVGDELYYEDFNVEVTHKFSNKVKGIFDYVYIVYNKDVIQGTPGYGTIYSTTGVAEIIWKITSKKALRTEVQHLYTQQDKKSWAMLLEEYTIAPYWSIAAFDMYNYGNDDPDHRIHYITGTVAFTKNANRFSFGYGKQREGIICVGGVCRTVPASNGFTLSISSSF